MADLVAASRRKSGFNEGKSSLVGGGDGDGERQAGREQRARSK